VENKDKVRDVSVIMAAYNAEKYIEETLISVLNQSYTNFEFLIVNDGSTDGTLDIIKKYREADNRIKVISRDNNEGCSYSRNEALSHASGQWIAIIDADDKCSSDRLLKQIDVMQNNDIDVCGSWIKKVDENNVELETVRYYESHEQILTHALFNCPVAHSTVMIRAETLNGLKYDEGLSYAEDYDLWIRMLLSGSRFHNIQEPLVMYRIHGQQASHDITSQEWDVFKSVQSRYLTWFSRGECMDVELLSRVSNKGDDFSVHDLRMTHSLWVELLDTSDAQKNVVKDNLAIFSIRSVALGWPVFWFYSSFFSRKALTVKYLIVIFILCLFGIEWKSERYKKLESIYSRFV